MTGVADFLSQNIIIIYFLYGLSFYSMGLAVFIETGHSSELDFANALPLLAGFGLLHGSLEWFEMFLNLNSHLLDDPIGNWLVLMRLILLAVSFLLLLAFGARLIVGPGQRRTILFVMMIVTVIWGGGLFWLVLTKPDGAELMATIDVYTRYALAIPGTVLTAWGLVLQCRRFRSQGMQCFGNNLLLAACAFAIYGAVGNLFSPSSAIFPASTLNADPYVQWFGLPIQVFRAFMACLIAIFTIRSMRGFEVENRRRIEELQEARLAEQQRLEAVRAELLHRNVRAQESERQRIARELHDETGQTLTALGMALRGLSETIASDQERAIQQAKQLENLAVSGIDELQRLVSGLHPPQLDDLGLVPAIRWWSRETEQLSGLPIEVTSRENGSELSPDIRIVFFRIAQEAITNIIRHANATKASVSLDNTGNRLRLRVKDNGKGFNVNETLNAAPPNYPSLGLLGMIERAALIGGECKINSNPGEGTEVDVQLELEPEGYG